MPTYDVYLLLPAAVWHGVEADSEEGAIAECQDTEPRLRGSLDPGEPHRWVAVECEGDEERDVLDVPDCPICLELLAETDLPVEEINAYHAGELDISALPKHVQDFLHAMFAELEHSDAPAV